MGKRFASSAILVADLSIDLQCVGSGRLIDRDEDRRFLVHPRARRVLQGAKLDTRDVTQSHDGFTRRPGADDDVAELLRIAEPADRIDLELERGARRRRRLPQPCRRRPGYSARAIAFWTSIAVMPRVASLSGSSHTRIE